jgi:hypothetical protein
MTKIRLLTKSVESGDRLKLALESRGFIVSYVVVDNDYYDAILADRGVVNKNSPVVIFTKQENVRHLVTEAIVAEKFKPLHDQLVECLALCKKE